MTLEEYKELGLKLAILHDRAVQLSVKRATTKRELRSSIEEKLAKQLRTVRSLLEEMLFKDYPKDATTYVFYPTKRTEEA